jgi:hypothetical protein
MSNFASDIGFSCLIGCVLGFCALLVAYLTCLEIREIRRNHDRRRRGLRREGLAFVVRGLGLRSEISFRSVTGASRIWTTPAPELDTWQHRESAPKTAPLPVELARLPLGDGSRVAWQ